MKYSYKCIECGSIQTLVRKLSEHENPVQCECSGECKQVILSPPVVSLDPISGDFPGATDKWCKHREGVMAKERRTMRDHGTYK